MRQGGTIGGGTTEMARNVISERVLSMPRERRLDKDVPFRDVPRGPPTAPSPSPVRPLEFRGVHSWPSQR